MTERTVEDLAEIAQGYDRVARKHRTCGEDCDSIVPKSAARYRAFTARKFARAKQNND